MGHFLLGMFKDRAVAMGKPHCNRSIRTFLVIAPTAFVSLAQDFILVVTSVSFRVLPWLIFLLFLILWLNLAPCWIGLPFHKSLNPEQAGKELISYSLLGCWPLVG
jgi:hypothetical protein